MDSKKYVRIEYTLDGEPKVYKSNDAAAVSLNKIIDNSTGHIVRFTGMSIVDENTLKSGKMNQKNLYF